MLAGGFMAPVVGFGSGKLVTPWARMQRDTARSFRSSTALTCCGVVGDARYSEHARSAAWNVGEEASLLETWTIWPLAALMPSGDPNEAGMGKFRIP